MKLMKKSIYTIFTALLLISVITIPIAASEGKADVNVSYTPGRAYAKVQLKLEVVGKGIVYDEATPIHEGILLYDMQEEDTKAFRIIPQDGYEISKVEYDDGYQVVNMISGMKEDRILVKLKDKNATLTIHFEEKKQEIITPEHKPEPKPEPEQRPKPLPNNKPETNQIDMNKGTPQTADVTSRGRLTSALIGAGFILVLLTYKRKKSKEDETK